MRGTLDGCRDLSGWARLKGRRYSVQTRCTRESPETQQRVRDAGRREVVDGADITWICKVDSQSARSRQHGPAATAKVPCRDAHLVRGGSSLRLWHDQRPATDNQMCRRFRMPRSRE
jgi:hypothetical protein